jgi:UDP-N-acetylglucosamine transferase subunit ALG13
VIFVSVGMQMPFDRLCKTVDAWGGERDRKDIFMQIGSTAWRPSNCEYVELLNPDEYADRVKQAEVLVMHAGTGSILAAMKYGKPIIVRPRVARLRETRNDHQLATVRRFKELSGITVALDEQELLQKLDTLHTVSKPEELSPSASKELISALRTFIHAAG